MSWLKIFKNVDVGDVVKQGMNGIDAVFFTNEEKAEYNKEMAGALAEYTKSTLSENTARSLTRRYIAVTIVAVFLLLVLTTVIFYPINTEYSAFVYNLLKDTLATPFTLVLAFYFGGYYLNKMAPMREKKKKE